MPDVPTPPKPKFAERDKVRTNSGIPCSVLDPPDWLAGEWHYKVSARWTTPRTLKESVLRPDVAAGD